MTYQNEIAQSLDALADELQSALDKIDSAIAAMDGPQLFDRLFFVEKYGDMNDEHHRILWEKLQKANAAHSAKSGHSLDIHLRRPDPTYRLQWQLPRQAGTGRGCNRDVYCCRSKAGAGRDALHVRPDKRQPDVAADGAAREFGTDRTE